MTSMKRFLAALLFAPIAAFAQSIPADQLRPIGEVWKTIESNFYLEVDRNELMRQAIEGLLKVDPYGAYYNEAAYNELKTSISATFAGIGVEIAKKDDAFRVVTPLEGSPAAAAGMRPNDLIVRVDDADLKGKTLEQVVSLIRGQPGTQVRISAVRSGTPLDLRITRAALRINPVRAKLVDPGIAYVRVSQFSDLTPEIFSKEVAALLGRTPRGVVLDLRSNPGGLFSAATAIASAFLPENLLVVKLDGRTKQEFRTTDKPYVSSDDGRAAAAVVEDDTPGGAHRWRYSVGRENRRCSFARPRACGSRRPEHVWQGGGADHISAARKYGDAPDDCGQHHACRAPHRWLGRPTDHSRRERFGRRGFWFGKRHGAASRRA